MTPPILTLRNRSLFVCLFAAFIAALSRPAFCQWTITPLASFNGTDGSGPYGNLLLSDNILYGNDEYGGANGEGNVFSVPATGGSPTVLATFSDSTGAYPDGGLCLSADGTTLYGTTSSRGPTGYNSGTIFSVPVGGGSPSVLATFNGTNGSEPYYGVTLSGSTLYGTAESGGPSNHGTVFSLPVNGGSPSTLASFNGSNGANPTVGLTFSGSTFFSTTANGGANGDGTVFSVPVGGGSPTVLVSFDGSNGGYPDADLTLSGNTLYGTTQNGGAYGDGDIFSIPITGGPLTVLASFDGSDGQYATGGMTLLGNILYGTTANGGANGHGEIFSIPASDVDGTPTVLASFNGSDGLSPRGDLTLSADGSTLYGATGGGGEYNDGIVYSVTVPEPTSAAVIGIGALGLLRRRRR